MENHVVYRTLMDYYREEDEDSFYELGFHSNPMKAYLYTITILHDTVICLACQEGIIYNAGIESGPRTAMYLRRVKRETKAKRDTVVRDAVDLFGREKMLEAITEEKNTPIQLMHMDEQDLSRIINSLRNLFFE